MKYILSLAGLILSVGIQAQSCHGATVAFADLGTDKSFVAAHAEPKQAVLEGEGTKIKFKTPDQSEGYAYFIPAKEASNKVLIVVHEWWGLNANIQAEAEKFSKLLPDVSIYAVDLYDGSSTSNREEAAQLMQSAKPERCTAIISGLLDKIGPEAEVATVGWCFGGGWSLQAALLAKAQVKSCVMYYGMPEKSRDRLTGLEAPVLFIHATKDQWINNQVVNDFKELAASCNVNLSVLEYEADHAFANPSNPQFQPEFTADAQEKVIAFLKRNYN